MEKIFEQCISDFVKFGQVREAVPCSSHGKVSLCGAYILKHAKTGRIYVGSTSDLYKRSTGHRSELRLNNHPVRSLQEAYNDDPSVGFFFLVTDNRDEARQYEQEILTKYFDTGLLFNIARDATAPLRGTNRTDETKQKLRLANLGKKLDEVTKEKIRQSCKATGRTPEQLEMFRQFSLKRLRSVSADGVVYKSMTEAASVLNMKLTTVQWRLSSPSFPSWFYMNE